MSGADWDAILSTDSTLDFEGVDLAAVTERLGALSTEERDDLVAALDAEKAKVVKRGNVVDTALDVFKTILGAVTVLLLLALPACTHADWIVPDEVRFGFAHNTGGDDFDAAYTGHRSFSYDEDDSQTYSALLVYKIKPTRMIVVGQPNR